MSTYCNVLSVIGVHLRASIDFLHHACRAVAVDLSTIGGICDPILSDFEKSEETALEKCLLFTKRFEDSLACGCGTTDPVRYHLVELTAG